MKTQRRLMESLKYQTRAQLSREAMGKTLLTVCHRQPQPHLNTLQSFHQRWIRESETPNFGSEPLHLEPGSAMRVVPHRHRPRQQRDCGQPGGLVWNLARRHCGR